MYEVVAYFNRGLLSQHVLKVLQEIHGQIRSELQFRIGYVPQNLIPQYQKSVINQANAT
jgi:hypothetical protein